jgi:hypothetical protein
LKRVEMIKTSSLSQNQVADTRKVWFRLSWGRARAQAQARPGRRADFFKAGQNIFVILISADQLERYLNIEISKIRWSHLPSCNSMASVALPRFGCHVSLSAQPGKGRTKSRIDPCEDLDK